MKQHFFSLSKPFLCFVLLWHLLMFPGCKTIDGVPQGAEVQYGTLVVSSNVDSAAIFIDFHSEGIFSFAGKYTSSQEAVVLDSVPVGRHQFELQKECYESTESSSEIIIALDQQLDIRVNMQLLSTFGALHLSTSIDGAHVLIDGLPQGVTPLTINCLAEGPHAVEIRKASYAPVIMNVETVGGATDTLSSVLQLQRTVLMEHFSSATCVPCVEADLIIEDVLAATGSHITASLGYHTEIPSPGDPLHIAAREDNDARIGYYNLITNPLIYFDGVVLELGTNNLENRIYDALDERLALPPDATIEIENYVAGDNTLTGTVTIAALTDIPDAVLYLAVIERYIEYAQAPGVNGQVHFFDVLRDLHPSADGTPISLDVGESIFVAFDIERDEEWVVDQLEIIAFLQVPATKEVLQSAWTLYP